MRRRSRSRELALQLLYMHDQRDDAEAFTDAFLAEETRDPQVKKFTRELVEGVLAHRTEIDERIRLVARNWELHRMAVIDRNVLRLSIYEILHCPDIPPKVSINEAIELVKRYSTQNSGSFVNGILDRIGKDSHGVLDTRSGPPRHSAPPPPPASLDS